MIVQNRSHLSPIFKPKCIIDYNIRIIGIDRQNQVLASFPIMRKFVKGYRKIIFYMCNMALLNPYILCNKNSMVEKQNYIKYILRIAEGLLQTVPLQNYNRQEPLSNGYIPIRRVHSVGSNVANSIRFALFVGSDFFDSIGGIFDI